MREPLNRTILLLDIERFGRRDDVVQAVLRRGLHTVVDRTLLAAGAEPSQQYREDRGDGVIVLLSGDVPKTEVLRALLTLTPELLHEQNRLASSSAQLRLRMVLASGEVAHDQLAGTTGGLVGHDLNEACRLLDADALRTALAERAGETCVLAISDPIYQGVVRHGHRGIRPESFASVHVTVKDGALSAWLHIGNGPAVAPPDPAAPGPAVSAAGDTRPAPAAQAPASGAVFHFHGAPVVHGSVVGGDQHGVSGGQVSGDVVLGGQLDRDHEHRAGTGEGATR
ncbi:hypothetical protein [Streptomyces sp. TLI_171]|uniref:hypothetical protein n=1 Tax=Streptomyces sp. TLI_171 TaxID=1938859 RepID=UPI000C1A38B2|nr:hypothetical protein [Streptomyces sp. TLI_171]RKE19865.1 hypothetical protein BX266_3196 [Streptomyces sp. TLI_171]